jgi:hypothetical protein
MSTALKAAPTVSAVTASVRDRPKRGGDVRQQEHCDQRVHDIRPHAHAAGDDELPPVMTHHFSERRAHTLLELRELRGLGDADAQPQAERDQHHAHEQRQAPSVLQPLLLRNDRGGEGDDAACDQRADRRAHLRERSVAAPLLVSAVFHRQQHSACPLAAKCHTLREAQCHQQDGREHADLCIRR